MSAIKVPPELSVSSTIRHLAPLAMPLIRRRPEKYSDSTITVAELTMKGQLVASSTFKYTSVLTMVAILYLVMSVPLILFVGWLERRMQQVKK